MSVCIARISECSFQQLSSICHSSCCAWANYSCSKEVGAKCCDAQSLNASQITEYQRLGWQHLLLTKLGPSNISSYTAKSSSQ